MERKVLTGSSPIILNTDMMIGENPPQTIFEMRDFINVCQDYTMLIFEEMEVLTSPLRESAQEAPALTESMLVSHVSHPVVDDLKRVVEDLRAYMESAGGDYALGVEDGMARAASMIETLITRHEV